MSQDKIATLLYFMCVDTQIEMINKYYTLKDRDCKYSLIAEAIKNVVSVCNKYRDELFQILYNENLHRMQVVKEKEDFKDMLDAMIADIKESLYMVDYTVYLTKNNFEDVDINVSFTDTIKELIQRQYTIKPLNF